MGWPTELPSGSLVLNTYQVSGATLTFAGHAPSSSSLSHTGESYSLIVPFTPSREQLKGSSFRSEG